VSEAAGRGEGPQDQDKVGLNHVGMDQSDLEERPFRQFVRDFTRSTDAVVALVVLLGVLTAAALAPVLSPQNPYDLTQIDILDNLQKPGSESMSGMKFLLGSDGQGRDILSAILYGLRTSLIVGAASVFIAVAIGVFVGLVSAYRGGWVDTVIMRIVDLQLSLPPILVALVLLVLLGGGVDKIILALVIVQWSFFARTIRGLALVENNREYMDAARGLRLGGLRVLFSHLLPNCLPTLIVIATVQVASAISLEATLSFLGLGLPPTEPSLGLLIANGFRYMMSGNYWVSVFPGIALLVTIMSINVLGDRLRDVLNPRMAR
jgi:peptide/nickel transport system permease protein